MSWSCCSFWIAAANTCICWSKFLIIVSRYAGERCSSMDAINSSRFFFRAALCASMSSARPALAIIKSASSSSCFSASVSLLAVLLDLLMKLSFSLLSERDSETKESSLGFCSFLARSYSSISFSLASYSLIISYIFKLSNTSCRLRPSVKRRLASIEDTFYFITTMS